MFHSNLTIGIFEGYFEAFEKIKKNNARNQNQGDIIS
jgi:hypothetical protein